MKKKIAMILFSFLLVTQMLICNTQYHANAAVAISESQFTPRVTAPAMSGYYANYWSNNCTRYVCCRVNEILGYSFFNVKYSAASPAGAGVGSTSIYAKLKAAGFQTGNVPKPGAVMVSSEHVGVLEAVSGNSLTWTQGSSFTKESNGATTFEVVIDGTRGTGKSTAQESGGTWFSLRKGIGYNSSTGRPNSGFKGTWYGYVYLVEQNPVTPDIKYASITPGDYQIINRAGGKYLNAYANAGQANNQTNVCASNADNSAEQKWKIESLGSNKYLIRSNSNSNLFCLDIATSGTPSSGTNVYLYSNTGYASKHWYFESLNNGYYAIRSALNPNLVLAAVDGNHRANVQVQSYNGGNNQQWQLKSLTAPVAATLTGISVASAPSKTSYYPWEALDASGLSLKLSYSDGSSKTVSSGFSCTPTGFSTYIGAQTITVSYEGKTTSFNVNVNAPSASYQYTKLKTFSFDGKTYEIYKENTLYENAKAFAAQQGGHLLTVTDKAENDAVISNWDSKATASEYLWLGGNDVEKEGEFVWITGEPFSYANWAANQPDNWNNNEDYLMLYPDGKWNDNAADGRAFSFCVEYEAIRNIEIESMPTKVEYNADESFDASGLKLNVTYTDGSRKIIDQGFSCTCPDLHTPGTKTVTVAYENKQTSFSVTVAAAQAQIEWIGISSTPNKTVYKQGDALDTTGLSIDLGYSDGTTETITDGLVCSPMELTAVGEQLITVSYADHTIEFTVIVNEKTDEISPPTSESALDFNKDGEVNSRDGIYLIYYTVFPEDFPITSAIDLDFNKDGEINSRDGIYLIYYTVFPEDFPIDLHLPSLHLSSAEAECGETVTLTLSADNLDAVSEIIINNFEIENSQISLVSCNILSTEPDVTDFEPNKKIAMLINNSNLNLSGELLALTFEIPDNTAPGKYTVSFQSIVNMYDDDEKLLNLPTDNSFGTIIVY